MTTATNVPRRDGVRDGDVIVGPGDGATMPPFVVRCEPGPDQFGCPTLAAATRLARAFASNSGVDVWLADRSGRVTALARFRGLRLGAAPSTRAARSPVPYLSAASVQNCTPPGRGAP